MGLFSSSKSSAFDSRVAGGTDESITVGASGRYVGPGAFDLSGSMGATVEGQDAPETILAAAGLLEGPLDYARDASAGFMDAQLELARLTYDAQSRATAAAVDAGRTVASGALQAAELAVGRSTAPDWSTLLLYGVGAWVLVSVFGK